MQIRLTIISICTFLFVSFSTKAIAFNTPEPDSMSRDTSIKFIEYYANTYTFRLSLSQPNLNLHLQDNDARINPITYSPNVNQSIGFGITYKQFGLSLSFRMKSPEDKDYKYGKTRYTNLKTNFNFKQLGFDGFYQHYEGFYLRDVNRYFPASHTMLQSPQHKELNITMFGINTYAYRNKNFSMKAAFEQTERQIRNCGSLMMMVSAKYTNLRDKQTMIPDTVKRHLLDLVDFRNGTFIDLNICPGIGYTYTKNHFYITPVVFAGVGLQTQDYNTTSSHYFKLQPSLKVNLRNALGYCSNRYFARLSYIMDMNMIYIEKSRSNIVMDEWELTVGYRINKLPQIKHGEKPEKVKDNKKPEDEEPPAKRKLKTVMNVIITGVNNVASSILQFLANTLFRVI